MKKQISPSIGLKAILIGRGVDAFIPRGRKIFAATTAYAMLIGFAIPSIAVAKPSCTAWMDQGDGTSWKECVNDDGSQHCYKISNKPGSKQY